MLLPECKGCKALSLLDALEERLHNMTIIERCTCTQGPILQMGFCDKCQDKGYIKRPATLEDIVAAMDVPTEIWRK